MMGFAPLNPSHGLALQGECVAIHHTKPVLLRSIRATRYALTDCGKAIGRKNVFG